MKRARNTCGIRKDRTDHRDDRLDVDHVGGHREQQRHVDDEFGDAGADEAADIVDLAADDVDRLARLGIIPLGGDRRDLVARCLHRALADPPLVELEDILQRGLREQHAEIHQSERDERTDALVGDRAIDDAALQVDWREPEQGHDHGDQAGIELVNAAGPPHEAGQRLAGADDLGRSVKGLDTVEKAADHLCLCQALREAM
jgi:hypothetical protein